MDLRGEQILLRIYLRSTDQFHLAPAYERIVQKAAAAKLAGATVLRGILGFGAGRILRHSPWHLADSVPMIVEIVDAPDRIGAFVNDALPQVLGEGLATLERAGVMMYRRRAGAPPHALELPGAVEPLSTLPAIQARGTMKAAEDGMLLRVFIGESDEAEGKPLHEAIVQKARELGLAGATVLRGSMGFGANSVLHTSKILTLSTDLPIVIELVDAEPKIQALLPYLETAVREGMITMEHVRILLYRHDPADAATKGAKGP